MARKNLKTGRIISVRFPPHLLLRLGELSKMHGTTVSVVIRALITKSIEEITDNKTGYEREDLPRGR